MTILTTGITNPGTVVPRLEIHEFVKDKELWDLYLQGLKSLQAVDQKDPLSWFQIAGIHGRPFVPYDHAGTRINPKSQFGGYCTHSSILFPPWHRPFLALFEQTLGQHIMDIANKYQGDDKAKYVAAAQRFRLPYWDWATNGVLPDVISYSGDVNVKSSTGSPTESDKFKNPLFAYTFHPKFLDSDGLRYSDDFSSSTTIRSPGVTDLNDLTQMKKRNYKYTIRQRILTLLSLFHTYKNFSNNQVTPDVGLHEIDSLEAVHDTIHGLIGGHMGGIWYSAFDPVFWLHHANVDRIFALWEAANPGFEITSQAAGRGNFMTGFGEEENGGTWLEPFRKGSGDDEFWSADDAKDTRTFKYTYPELENWAKFTPEEKQSKIATEINKMYQDVHRVAAAEAATKLPVQRAARVVSSVRPSEQTEQHVASAMMAAEEHPVIQDSRSYLEWVVNVIVGKYVANSTFHVHIFLGDFNSEPSMWSEDPNLVGTHTTFTSKLDETRCERCQQGAENGILVGGTIPLTDALVKNVQEGKIPDLSPEHVAPFLRTQLHWRIQRVDGSVIERSDLPSLRISVVNYMVTVPNAIDKFPTRGDAHEVLSITAGRPGGAGDAA